VSEEKLNVAINANPAITFFIRGLASIEMFDFSSLGTKVWRHRMIEIAGTIGSDFEGKTGSCSLGLRCA